MGDAIVSADALVDLALAPGTTPTVRLILLAAERADALGVAEFDEDELWEALGESRSSSQQRLSRAQVGHKVRLCATLGYFLPRSSVRRIRLNLERIKPQGWGLRAVHELHDGRAVAECSEGHRATYSVARLEAGTAACGRCRA